VDLRSELTLANAPRTLSSALPALMTRVRLLFVQ
jgi:hypothetical protein